jgi:8-oxo-dGTP diphosphatase
MDNQLPRHSVSVSGAIPDDHGRVLELAETIHDGLRREVREETGLDIEPGPLTGVYKNVPRGIVALVFRCKITGGHLIANGEVTAFHWADEADIRQLTSQVYAVRTPPIDLKPRPCRDRTPRPSRPATRRHRITAAMSTGPRGGWTGKELAELLQVKPHNMLTQLAEWTRLGFLTRTSAGTYALASPP